MVLTSAMGVEWDGGGRRRLAAQLVAGAVAALLVAPMLTAPGHHTTAPVPDVDVIVRSVSANTDGARRAVVRAGGTVARRLGIIHGFTAKVPADRVDQVRHAAGVAAVTPNGRGHLLGVDPTLGYDTAADLGSPASVASMINANPAYSAGITGKGVDVAVIDSGVVPVEGLSAPGKVVNGPDLSFDSQNPATQYLDGYGHGTHIAGLIAGKDSAAGTKAAFTGVAPDARIVNVKTGASDGSVDVSQVIAALDWVVQHRNDNGLNIRVINLSFGTDAAQGYLLDPLAYAAEVAWRKGIVVVAAGGNDGKDSDTLADPAIDPYVVAVGASDPNGTVQRSDDRAASFSSKGSRSRGVDVLAPGRSVLSLRDPGSRIDTENPAAVVGTRFFRGSGTSQAAAVTSGAVALLLQQRPNLTPDQVKALLKGNAFRITAGGNDRLNGSGLVDVGKALAAPTPLAVQTWPAATGLGSLEQARGSSHVVDPSNGVALTGEQDIFGKAWLPSVWANASLAGSSWSGGDWNGSTWSGSTWSGSSWSGSSWSGSTWSGSTWSGSTWSGSTWSGSTWSGSTWSGSTWSGSTWSGSTWSGSTWSGSSWSGAGWN